MIASVLAPPRRILIVDDSRAIHDDFHKILGGNESAAPVGSDEAASRIDW